MKRFRNSDLIIPISLVMHLAIINGTLYLLTPETYLNLYFVIYLNLIWLLITFLLNFYPTDRNENFMTRIDKHLKALFFYSLAYFGGFSFFNISIEYLPYQAFVYLLISLCITWYRVMFFWVRGKYRMVGGNSVRIVVIGSDGSLHKVRDVFDQPNLGYRYHGYFDDSDTNDDAYYLGKVIDCFKYILENNIDEIYCVASKFNPRELKNLINFADNNLIKFKVILDNKDIFSRAMSIESYENIPVLNLRKVPLDTEYAKIMKRTFDIIFSSLIIVGILSWLTPLLFILIKLESPGKLYFKQKRHGLKRKIFWCYKFRSMTTNSNADKQMATKNDARITRIGAFLRRTSIDELPQFFNVFMGDMSVIGPRPHMELQTWDYEISVDKYLVRHFVKPGITGLAQIKGYRGEIVEKSDILNRVRLDIFYVEKWNPGLDFLILFRTIYNLFSGEEKAY